MEIQKILLAVGKAYRDFAASFSKDKTTDELFATFEASLKESLGEYEIVYDYIWGKDTLNIDGVTKNYHPRTGDTLIMDISVGVGGVFCDVCRTYFVGEPTVSQTEAYETVLASLRRGHKALREGTKASDVYEAVDGVYRQKGKTLVHHAGHRIAEKPLLQPQFLPENDTPLEDGLYYTVESGLYEDFGIRLENDFLIEKTGAKDLFENILPLNIKEYILK